MPVLCASFLTWTEQTCMHQMRVAQYRPSQTSGLMRAQGCCEGFCDDQNIAGQNNPDVRSDLSKQEARKRPERALLSPACSCIGQREMGEQELVSF